MPAPAGAAFAVLADVARYPRWWPQVRSVERIDDEQARLRVRSALPYNLDLQLRSVRVDRAVGVLEAALSGDLVGRSRWTVRPVGAGCSIRFDEQADLGVPWLRRLEPLARPAFVANHAFMMRGARRGLAAALSGYGSATDPPPPAAPVPDSAAG